MGPFEMVVLIVLIVTAGQVLRVKMQRGGRRTGIEGPEAQKMREEIKLLRDRVAVLERIAIDKDNALEREIELLRDR